MFRSLVELDDDLSSLSTEPGDVGVTFEPFDDDDDDDDDVSGADVDPAGAFATLGVSNTAADSACCCCCCCCWPDIVLSSVS